MSDCPYCHGTGGKPVRSMDATSDNDWLDCPACGGTGDYSISDRRIRKALLGDDE